MTLITKEYVAKDDRIEVVEKPSKDIAQDEAEEEGRLVKAIVEQWNSVVTEYENMTVKFAVIVQDILKDYPMEKKIEIIKKVKSHPDIKTTVSKDRIYQGLRLIESRPELLKYSKLTPDELSELPDDMKPYLKKDGSMFWEFYFELYKHSLKIDKRALIEAKGIEDQWTVRELQTEIRKATGDSESTGQQKYELIKSIIAMLRTLDISLLGKAKEYINSLAEPEEKEQ